MEYEPLFYEKKTDCVFSINGEIINEQFSSTCDNLFLTKIEKDLGLHIDCEEVIKRNNEMWRKYDNT